MKLKHDKPLSSFAVKFNIRRFSKGAQTPSGRRRDGPTAFKTNWDNIMVTVNLEDIAESSTGGGGLHSFTLQINLSNSRTHS